MAQSPIRILAVKRILALLMLGALISGCNNNNGYIPATSSGMLDDATLRGLVDEAARDNNVPNTLLYAMLQAESGGNPDAISRDGAMGLMQLMPATAAACHVQSAFDPRENVECGASYLAQMLARFKNNVALAVAAYNAGPNAVAQYHGIPPFPETQVYVRRVLNAYESAGGAPLLSTQSLACVPNGPCPPPP